MSAEPTTSANDLGSGRAGSPSCHDAVTMTCPVCQQPFTPVGRQKYCTDACRAAAYRRRGDAGQLTVVVPKAQPRRPVTVYECDACGARALGTSAATTAERSCAGSASAVSARAATRRWPSMSWSARR